MSVLFFCKFSSANFVKRRFRSIKEIKVRYKPVSAVNVKNTDVIGFDENSIPLVMAECKHTSVKFDHIDRWIENTKRMFAFSKGELEDSMLVTTEKMTDECINHLETNPIINNKGQLKVVSGFTGTLRQHFGDSKTIRESGKVFLSVYEVRRNEFTKVFPRK